MASGTTRNLLVRGARTVLRVSSKESQNYIRCCARTVTSNKKSRHRFSTSASCSTIFKSTVPDIDLKNQSVAEFLFPRYAEYGDRVALTDFTTGQSYTYTQVKDISIKVASALTKMGYKKGDIIAIYSTNNPEFVLLMHAAASIGVILTTVNPAYSPGELARHLEHSRATAIVCLAPLVNNVKEAIEGDDDVHIKDIITIGNMDGYRPFSNLMEDDGKAFPENVDINAEEDVYVLPYSSGTTGLPKGVMLTHRNILANLHQYYPYLEVTSDDTSLAVLPFFHIYGMCPIMLGVLKDGGKLVTLPKFDPEMFLKACHGHKVTQLHIVPPIVVFLAKHPVVSKFDLSSLNRVVSGAAPLGESITAEFMDRLKAPITQGYGLTETSPVTHLDNLPPTPGAIGVLCASTECKIVNPETDELLGVGETGEICIRGPQVMKGYLHNQAATDDMIKDGWLHTGDVGYADEKHIFRVTDRLKELVKYKGYQVPPAELEDLLLKHPAVQDAAVIGMPDDEAGELPRAYIVCKPDKQATASDIIHYVESNVAPYKKLRGGVEFVKEIPKSPSGKILRRILRESLHRAT